MIKCYHGVNSKSTLSNDRTDEALPAIFRLIQVDTLFAFVTYGKSCVIPQTIFDFVTIYMFQLKFY